MSVLLKRLLEDDVCYGINKRRRVQQLKRPRIDDDSSETTPKRSRRDDEMVQVPKCQLEHILVLVRKERSDVDTQRRELAQREQELVRELVRFEHEKSVVKKYFDEMYSNSQKLTFEPSNYVGTF